MSRLDKVFIGFVIIFAILWIISIIYFTNWLFSDESAKAIHHWLLTAQGKN